MRFIRTVVVPASPERVFPYLSDFTTTTEWDPASVRTERVSGDGGVGTEYRNVSRFLGREAEVRYVVTDVEPGRRFALRGENEALVAHDVMSLAGGPDGTTVTYAATFDLKGWRRLGAPLLMPAFRRLVDQGAVGLERALRQL